MIALNLQIYQLEGVTMKLNDIEYEHFDAKKIPEMARNLDYIFKYNKDISKAAYLNQRMSHSSDRNQFNVMGEAFFLCRIQSFTTILNR